MIERRSDWGGVIAVGPWWLLYTGAFGPTGGHAHHAVQIICSTTQLTIAHSSDDSSTGMTITIPSDFTHAIVSSGRATMLFVDADSAVGRLLTARCDGRPCDADILLPTTNQEAKQTVDRILSIVDVAPAGVASQVSSSIAVVLAELADDPGTGTLTEFARRFGLSPSRFSQRFAREVGIPLRSYRRWARMLQAIDSIAAGASLTLAAHHAGFSDSAHLSHTFRDHFGLSPTDLLAATRFQQLD